MLGYVGSVIRWWRPRLRVCESVPGFSVTGPEAAALCAVGSYLGGVYRAELAERVRLGALDRTAQGEWRTRRKQAIMTVSSSRWAGAITRSVEDQYQLGMRNLSAYVSDLNRAVAVVAQRCELRPGERSPQRAEAFGLGHRRRRGYRSASERFAKTRRLGTLTNPTDGSRGCVGGWPAVNRDRRETPVAQPRPPRCGRDHGIAVAGTLGRIPNVSDRRWGIGQGWR